jgi:hypothetical protein
MMAAWYEVPVKPAVAIRSRRVRCDLRLHRKPFRIDIAVARSWVPGVSGQAVPNWTEPSFGISRHFVPGYHHSVPLGRISLQSLITSH